MEKLPKLRSITTDIDRRYGDFSYHETVEHLVVQKLYIYAENHRICEDCLKFALKSFPKLKEFSGMAALTFEFSILLEHAPALEMIELWNGEIRFQQALTLPDEPWLKLTKLKKLCIDNVQDDDYVCKMFIEKWPKMLDLKEDDNEIHEEDSDEELVDYLYKYHFLEKIPKIQYVEISSR